MKTTLLCIAGSLLGLALGWAQEAEAPKKEELRSIGRLPEDRKLELPQKTDRNPFAVRATKKKVEVASGDSEDARLHTKISAMKITGIIQDAQGGYILQFGSESLKEGDELRPMVKDQTVKLRVSKLTDKAIEISWVEKDPGVEVRKKTRQFNLGTGAIREKLSEEIMVYRLANGESFNPSGTVEEAEPGDETAQLQQEAQQSSGIPSPRTGALTSGIR